MLTSQVVNSIPFVALSCLTLFGFVKIREMDYKLFSLSNRFKVQTDYIILFHRKHNVSIVLWVQNQSEKYPEFFCEKSINQIYSNRRSYWIHYAVLFKLWIIRIRFKLFGWIRCLNNVANNYHILLNIVSGTKAFVWTKIEYFTFCKLRQLLTDSNINLICCIFRRVNNYQSLQLLSDANLYLQPCTILLRYKELWS